MSKATPQRLREMELIQPLEQALSSALKALARAEERIRALEAGLGPFAKLAEALRIMPGQDREAHSDEATFGAMDLTAGDLRRARALLPPNPQATGDAKMNGAELIAAERKRQIEEEGWSAEHDTEHDQGALAAAAAAYSLHYLSSIKELPESWRKTYVDMAGRAWPFDDEWWKPGTDPQRALVKAGALIAAEIDRLQGSSALPPNPQETPR